MKPATLPTRVLVFAATLACGTVALASVPSVEECLEGSDFIANAARARDNGVPRERFLERLDADFYAIRAFPPALRWFARDGDDEAFLRNAAVTVFAQPL